MSCRKINYECPINFTRFATIVQITRHQLRTSPSSNWRAPHLPNYRDIIIVSQTVLCTARYATVGKRYLKLTTKHQDPARYRQLEPSGCDFPWWILVINTQQQQQRQTTVRQKVWSDIEHISTGACPLTVHGRGGVKIVRYVSPAKD